MSAARSAMFAKPDAHVEGVDVPQKYLPPPLVLSTVRPDSGPPRVLALRFHSAFALAVTQNCWKTLLGTEQFVERLGGCVRCATCD